jgi:general secretion pathway protein G
MQPRIHGAAGFTLIELMVVIVILGLLAAIVVPNVVGRTDQARYTAAEAQIEVLKNALKLYKLDNGIYPSTEQGLEALVRKPSSGVNARNWRDGGYLDKHDIPVDPWGNQYVYFSPGLNNPDYDLKSFGADGIEGGEGYNADIESWRSSHR